MYLNQLIQYHRDLRCGGAHEHLVIASLAQATGVSYASAAAQVETAVLMKDIRRVKCTC